MLTEKDDLPLKERERWNCLSRDLNPRLSGTRLGCLKDALPTELQRHGHYKNVRPRSLQLKKIIWTFYMFLATRHERRDLSARKLCCLRRRMHHLYSRYTLLRAGSNWLQPQLPLVLSGRTRSPECFLLPELSFWDKECLHTAEGKLEILIFLTNISTPAKFASKNISYKTAHNLAFTRLRIQVFYKVTCSH